MLDKRKLLLFSLCLAFALAIPSGADAGALDVLKGPAAKAFLEETAEGAALSQRFFGKALKAREIERLLSEPRFRTESARFQSELEASLLVRDPVFAERPTLPDPTAPRNALEKIGGFFKKMKECLKNAPPGAAHNHRLRYFLTQLGVEEAITAGGYIASAGSQPIDWKNLPTDLMVEGVESFLHSTLVASNGPFLLRWIRIGGMGAASAGADAVIYYLSPLKDTHGVSADVIALQRMGYHFAFDVAEAPVDMTLFELLGGMECLNPGVQWKVASSAIQFGYAVGTSVLYFSLRKHFVAQGTR